MGQSISLGGPGSIFVQLLCDCRCQMMGIYAGPDYIALRNAIHHDGWRRRDNKWYSKNCVPKGKDDGEN